MGVYERILVPVEGTETDGPVLDHIAELAGMCGAEVTLLRVAHYHTATSAPASSKTPRATWSVPRSCCAAAASPSTP